VYIKQNGTVTGSLFCTCMHLFGNAAVNVISYVNNDIAHADCKVYYDEFHDKFNRSFSGKQKGKLFILK
jgi:hypothetical protein